MILIFLYFLSAAQPTDQGEEILLLLLVVVVVIVVVVVVGGFGDCFPFSHAHSKWVHPEKTFLQNGYLHKKTFSAKLMHRDKTILQNGRIKSLLLQNLEKELVCLLKSLFMS